MERFAGAFINTDKIQWYSGQLGKKYGFMKSTVAERLIENIKLGVFPGRESIVRTEVHTRVRLSPGGI